MPWDYISHLLGPGLHWGHTQEKYAAAIEQAEKDGQLEAVDHINMIWERRNLVMMEKKTAPSDGSR